MSSHIIPKRHRIGSHMSIAGGVEKAIERGASIGCRAIQIFVKNNNRWEGPPISETSAKTFRENLRKHGIRPEDVFAHTCYLINLASVKPEVVEKSIAALEDELRRCEQLAIPGLVMHPGSPRELGREHGITTVGKHVRDVLLRIKGGKCRLLFEGTAGTGSNLGATFEDLRDLLAEVNLPDRTGICLDTCHLFAAGYDLRTAETFKATMDSFDRIVGLKNLKAFHLNDSKHPLGSRKDRHEHIGKGHLGEGAFRHLLADQRLLDIPMSLETDKGDDLAEDVENLKVLARLGGPWFG